MFISAVIITKNEEKNVERCLQSLVMVADEILVIDSFSEDNTKAICNCYPVKFVEQQWLGYAEQKNFAHSLATYSIILSIDADEALSEQLQQEILQLKKEEESNIAVQIRRLNYFCNRWIQFGVWCPDHKIRIFHKHYAFWEDTKVHEKLHLKHAKLLKFKGKLLHYPYASVAEYEKTIDRYSTLYAQYCFEKGKKNSLFLLILKLVWTFFFNYIFKLGFLDGYAGLNIMKINLKDKIWRYKKLKYMKKGL
jgi:glycosyltransferase involved in cell wall biosynthesis